MPQLSAIPGGPVVVSELGQQAPGRPWGQSWPLVGPWCSFYPFQQVPLMRPEVTGSSPRGCVCSWGWGQARHVQHLQENIWLGATSLCKAALDLYLQGTVRAPPALDLTPVVLDFLIWAPASPGLQQQPIPTDIAGCQALLPAPCMHYFTQHPGSRARHRPTWTPCKRGTVRGTGGTVSENPVLVFT